MPLGWYYKMKTFLKPYQAEVYIPQMVQVYFPGTIPGVPVFFPDFSPIQPTFYIEDNNF